MRLLWAGFVPPLLAAAVSGSDQVHCIQRGSWPSPLLGDSGSIVTTVVAAGVQGSGKSTLLNTLFGTSFPVQPEGSPGTRTTVGAAVQVKNISSGTAVVIDLEGGEGRERNDASFEGRIARFAVACGDVILVSVWSHDAARGLGIGTLRSILEEASLQDRCITTVVVLRDLAERDGEEDVVFDAVRKGVADVLSPEHRLLCYSLPHPKHRGGEFAAAAAELRRRLTDRSNPKYFRLGKPIERMDGRDLGRWVEGLWTSFVTDPGGQMETEVPLKKEEGSSVIQSILAELASTFRGLEAKVKQAGYEGFPILEYGTDAAAVTEKAVDLLSASSDSGADGNDDEAVDELLCQIATCLQMSYDLHLQQLCSYFHSKFEDKFSTMMGGADDFEHDAAALQMDVLSGLKTAVDIATPRKLSKWWDGHSDATVLQLQSEISDMVEDRLAEGTWMLPSDSDAYGTAADSADMPRWKRLILRAAVFALNYVQATQGQRIARRDSIRRERVLPQYPLF